MCDELRRITNEQVEKGRKFQDETEKMLKKLEIWGLNLQHLLKKRAKREELCFWCGIGGKEIGIIIPRIA